MPALKSWPQWIQSATFPTIKWGSNLCPVKTHKCTTLASFRYNRRVVEVFNNSIILLNNRLPRITEVRVRRRTRPNRQWISKNGAIAPYWLPRNRHTQRNHHPLLHRRSRREIPTSYRMWVRFRTYYRVHQAWMAEEVPQGRPAHLQPVQKAKAPWRQV